VLEGEGRYCKWRRLTAGEIRGCAAHTLQHHFVSTSHHHLSKSKPPDAWMQQDTEETRLPLQTRGTGGKDS